MGFLYDFGFFRRFLLRSPLLVLLLRFVYCMYYDYEYEHDYDDDSHDYH